MQHNAILWVRGCGHRDQVDRLASIMTLSAFVSIDRSHCHGCDLRRLKPSPLLLKKIRDGSGFVIARINWTMALDGIHQHHAFTGAVDRCMGDAGRDLDPKTIGVAEMNALESFVLQNHQVEAASQNHQLIGLIAMAIKIRIGTWFDFGDQSFITKERVTEESNS